MDEATMDEATMDEPDERRGQLLARTREREEEGA